MLLGSSPSRAAGPSGPRRDSSPPNPLRHASVPDKDGAPVPATRSVDTSDAQLRDGRVPVFTIGGSSPIPAARGTQVRRRPMVVSGKVRPARATPAHVRGRGASEASSRVAKRILETLGDISTPFQVSSCGLAFPFNFRLQTGRRVHLFRVPLAPWKDPLDHLDATYIFRRMLGRKRTPP